MKLALRALAVFLVIGALEAWLLWASKGWRQEAPRLGSGPEPSAAARPLSQRDRDAVCRQAILAVPGLKPGLPAAELSRTLREYAGEAGGETLRQAVTSGRAVVIEDALFFPSDRVCGEPDLPEPCAGLCARVSSRRR